MSTSAPNLHNTLISSLDYFNTRLNPRPISVKSSALITMPPKGGNAKKESGRAKKAENEAKKQEQAAAEKVS